MQNEPNLKQSQIFITSIKTMSYNEKSKLDTWSKRTQTKPILPAIAGKIALSEACGEHSRTVEGPMESNLVLSAPVLSAPVLSAPVLSEVEGGEGFIVSLPIK
jgi:hypothetical protein